jgi:hypothetical protein
MLGREFSLEVLSCRLFWDRHSQYPIPRVSGVPLIVQELPFALIRIPAASKAKPCHQKS